ncbi:Uncharacterised protein [Bordetella pertussis]|nr:Uncharacterised protein [Bordetella pertussis]
MRTCAAPAASGRAHHLPRSWFRDCVAWANRPKAGRA